MGNGRPPFGTERTKLAAGLQARALPVSGPSALASDQPWLLKPNKQFGAANGAHKPLEPARRARQGAAAKAAIAWNER